MSSKKTSSPAYEKFLGHTREIYALRSASALLGWDQETCMPSGGGDGRAEAQSALSKVIQEKICQPVFGDILEECAGQGQLSLEAQANVREMARDREKLLKIPSSLTEEMARTTSLSQQAWGEARKTGTPGKFLPWLEKVIHLKHQEADCLGYAEEPYDALLDAYEPYTKTSEIAAILKSLEQHIVPLLQKITHAATRSDRRVFQNPFPLETQKKFNQKILQDMHFDLVRGRLDESAHPFTQGVWPTDVRLTTRYSESDFFMGLYSTLHEGGHGLYEQGFLPEHFGTPLGEAVSLGVHESQSRLWENHVGKSRAFLKRYWSPLKKSFPDALDGLSLEGFYAAVNQVEPSLIRVEADEVTYNLHIILRFEVERAIFAENLKVGDIEAAWNQKMKQTLGLTPKHPNEGFLQDVHWSLGLFGYFPTYSLGNIYGAQIFARMEHDLAPLEEKIEAGKFGELLQWLRENVHRHGRFHSPAGLIKEATGNLPTASYFVQYLEKKFSELYGF